MKHIWTISSALEFLKKRGVKLNRYKNHILILPWGLSNTACGALDFLHKKDNYRWGKL